MTSSDPKQATKANAEKGAKPPAFPYEKYITTSELVLLRNHYYYDSYRRIMVIFLCLLILVITLTAAAFYERSKLPPPVYFATTNLGTPIQLLKLKESNVQPAALIEWAVEAATAAYTFNFVNYRKAFQDARSYFTKKGYDNFIQALKDSNNMIAVKDRKLVVSARINGEASILKDSNSDPNFRTEGAYTWQVEVPMILTYESATEKFVQNIILTMVITRVSMLESIEGLGIDSFIVREIT